jgi:hypothetical protein
VTPSRVFGRQKSQPGCSIGAKGGQLTPSSLTE